MFKKGFSTILIVVIVLVVIAGGTLAWQYWPEPVEQDQQETEQVEQPIDNEQPETNGSNQSAISILLEELKQATQLNFLVEGVEFSWNLTRITDAREYMSIQGEGFELLNTESSNYSKINSFFQNNGFENDMENSGDATIKGVRGYKKDNIVCIVGSASLFSGGMATGKSDVKVSCGEKE